MSTARRVVDAHLHLWDLDRSAYAWLTPEHGPLHRTVPAREARAELDACGVREAVLVQAEDSERDTEFLLEVAASEDWVAGVVGWVQLDDPAVAEGQLDRWQRSTAFRGVRHLLHDDPREGLLAAPAVRATLRLLAERDLAFDVPDAWPRHLGDTAALARALPELRIVVDHLGKPPYATPAWDDWRAALAAVAAEPGTVAKVSGLQPAAGPFTAEVVRPAWEAALELYGPDRLMWGSDWPMTLRCGGYRAGWEVLDGLVGELAPAERDAVLARTAERTYRLQDRAQVTMRSQQEGTSLT
jgi:L-fuconolactonase